MGPNEKEGKASSSGTRSSDWVKTDWVILNRYATGSSWTDTRLGHRQPNTRIELIRGVGLRGSRSSWTDRDWVILSRLRGLMDTRYADWTGTRSESSWTDCAGWTVRDLGLLERITRMWVVLNRIRGRYADRVFLNWFTRSERIRDWYAHWVFLNRIHGSLQLNLSCHSTNSVHRLDDWRIYSDYDELTEAA